MAGVDLGLRADMFLILREYFLDKLLVKNRPLRVILLFLTNQEPFQDTVAEYPLEVFQTAQQF